LITRGSSSITFACERPGDLARARSARHVDGMRGSGILASLILLAGATACTEPVGPNYAYGPSDYGPGYAYWPGPYYCCAPVVFLHHHHGFGGHHFGGHGAHHH
jgi:hypothetical protein